MSIHLVGGGRDAGHLAAAYGSFVAESEVRALQGNNKMARVGIIVLYEAESEGTEQYSRFASIVSQLGACQPVPFLLQEGERLAAAYWLILKACWLPVG